MPNMRGLVAAPRVCLFEYAIWQAKTGLDSGEDREEAQACSAHADRQVRGRESKT